MSDGHKYRWMVNSSDVISDAELTELETKIPLDSFYNEYEYSGNFIISKDVIERDSAVEHMCCGIVTKDVLLDSGEWIYFAFDYGH